MFVAIAGLNQPKLRRSGMKKGELIRSVKYDPNMPLLWSLGSRQSGFYKHGAPNGAFKRITFPPAQP
jgi:hypothetical protein